jgi:glycosyltransferase involved in cell wall biosynthesis
MPLVTIITPLFNKGYYVQDTIRSVQFQTLSDWEMIVVENGSTDDGPATVRVMATADSRLRLLTAPHRGPGAARNYGLDKATGEWVLFLDADDLLEPKQLATLLAAGESQTHAGVVAGGWQEFQHDAPGVRVFKHPAGVGQPHHGLLASSIAFAPWAVHAALVRRHSLNSDCRWPEQLDRFLGEDIAFWFKLLLKNEVVYCEASGAIYRVATECCRSQRQRVEEWYEGVHAAIETNLQVLASLGCVMSAAQVESLTRAYAELYWVAHRQGHSTIASEALTIANRWLAERVSYNEPLSWPIRLRHWLGLRGYATLQHWWRRRALLGL